MSNSEILVTAAVGLVASVVTAVVTHLLTRAQERRKYEREVAGKLADLKSADRNQNAKMAVAYGHSCFVVERPGGRDRVFLPIGSRITLGKGPNNDIRISGAVISRTHAAFRADGEFAYVEPLAATNGLALNGEIINKPTKLSVGDVITIPGDSHRITFVPLIR
jgi:pSer/pThr/pTyr-binding forkhead associated (FHA) protein